MGYKKNDLSDSSDRRRRVAKGLLAMSVTFVVLATIVRISAYWVGTSLVRTMQGSTPFWVFVAWPVVVMIGVLLVALEARSRSAKAAVAAVGAVSMLWFGLGVRAVNRSHFEGVNNYVSALTETSGAHSTYRERLNLPQARLLIKQSMSGTQGELGDATYVANGAQPEFCAPVSRDGTLGRSWYVKVLCLDPATGSVRSADFEFGRVGTPGGRWSSKLGDQVASVRRGLVFDDGDVYPYITADGKARLVVPVTRKSGFGGAPHDDPAGVVIFDEAGHRQLKETLTPGEIPGPVMPMSVAARVRDALNTRSGFLAYRSPSRSQASLQTTSGSGSGSAADVNAENASEFVLLREDGRLVYVTMLTPYGQSPAVVAMLEVVADEVHAGDMPAATLVHLTASEASTSRVAQRVTSLYDADIDWADLSLPADAATKARIFEITPTTTGAITLTVGTGAQTLYRVRVATTLDANQNFGDICVYNYRTDALIRCDGSAADPTPVGSLRGLASQAAGQTPAPLPVNGELSAMSDEDIAHQIELLAAELSRRLGESSPVTTGSSTTTGSN